MWIKFLDDRCFIVYQYEPKSRFLTSLERDGSDVLEHFHEKAVLEVEGGVRRQLVLYNIDQSYPDAMKDFYEDGKH